MPLKIFIDTEFTNLIAPQLVSIGLVAESGEKFYAELPVDAKECSEFVREVVLPLLGQEPHARMTDTELFMNLNAWLRLVRPSNEGIEICYDAAVDWFLLSQALNGQVPAWCSPRLVDDRISELLGHDFHIMTALPEHHALHDARANCYAFRERVF